MEVSMMHYSDDRLIYIPIIEEFDAEELAPIINLQRKLEAERVRYEVYGAYTQKNGAKLIYYDLDYDEGIIARCLYCYHINHTYETVFVEYVNSRNQLKYIEIGPRSYGIIKLE